METGTCTIQHTITVCSTLVVCMEALRTTHLVCTYDYTCVLHASLLPPFLPSVWYVHMSTALPGWLGVCSPRGGAHSRNSGPVLLPHPSMHMHIRMQAHSSYIRRSSQVWPAIYPLLPACHDTYTYMRTYTGYVRMYVRTCLLAACITVGRKYIGDSTPPD